MAFKRKQTYCASSDAVLNIKRLSKYLTHCSSDSLNENVCHQVMLFVTAIFQILTYSFGDILNSVGAAGKVFEYLDRKPQVSTDGKLKPDQLTGHVSFRGLNFAYPSCPNKTVLQVKSEVQVDKEEEEGGSLRSEF